MFRSESIPSCEGCRLCMIDWPRTLAADRSVNALWPLAAGCLTYISLPLHINNRDVSVKQQLLSVVHRGGDPVAWG